MSVNEERNPSSACVTRSELRDVIQEVKAAIMIGDAENTRRMEQGFNALFNKLDAMISGSVAREQLVVEVRTKLEALMEQRRHDWSRQGDENRALRKAIENPNCECRQPDLSQAVAVLQDQQTSARWWLRGLALISISAFLSNAIQAVKYIVAAK